MSDENGLNIIKDYGIIIGWGLGILGTPIIGFFKVLFDFVSNKMKIQSEAQQKFKEERFKAIILQAYTLVYYEREHEKLRKHRPDLISKDTLFYELNMEMVNMSLYAKDETIHSLKDFLKKPSEDAFSKFVIEMRKELFGIKTKLAPEDFRFSP